VLLIGLLVQSSRLEVKLVEGSMLRCLTAVAPSWGFDLRHCCSAAVLLDRRSGLT
jgi:hypothetical protein